MTTQHPYLVARLAELRRRQLLAEAARAQLVAQARRPETTRSPFATVAAILRRRTAPASRAAAEPRPAAASRPRVSARHPPTRSRTA
jgi:hypothetical protein